MGTKLSKVGDEKFSNWVKDTLALLCTKECLEVIADERSAVFHGQLKTAVGNNATCTCNWQALNQDRKKQKWVVKNCPGVCQNWLDLIISHHSNRPLPKLAPKNTDPGRWPSDTWEVMKIYQSNGCQGHRSALDADVAALIDLMRNCDHFAPLITNPSLINQVITVRNKLMHSKDFKVENQELSLDLHSMLSFLHSLTAITGAASLSTTEHQAVMTAITKVDKLRTSILDMTLNRELQLKALKAKQVALETDMKLLEQTVNEARADTAAVKLGLTGVEDKLSTEVQTLQQRLVSQLSMIQDVKKDMTLQQRLVSQLSMIQDVKKDMTLQQRLVSQLSMIQNVKKNKTVKQQSTATVVSNLGHLQQQFDDLSLDHDGTKKNITALKQQISDLEVTSQNQQQESQAHASQLEKHQRELDTHTTKLSQLELRQGELDTHIPILQAHATQLPCHQSQIESQHTTLDSHATQLQGHQSHIESQHRTLDSHSTQLQGHQSHIESQHRTLDSHSTQLQGHQSHIESQHKTLDSHSTQLQCHQSHIESQHRTLDSHSTQLQGHQSHIESQHKTLERHSTQLQGYQSHIESQHKTLECHGAKLDRLENEQIALHSVQAVDIKGLQRKLIRMYEVRRPHIPMYLLRSERKIRLEDIYVEQCLKVVDPDGRLRTDCTLNSRHQARSGIIRIRAEEGISEPRTSENFISSLREVFYTEGNKCQYIYVSGNAGYGKSVFCSHLVRLWCKAHSEQSAKLNPDEELMAGFPLLFCVDLRDATYEGTGRMSDEMCSLIHKQLHLSQVGLTGNDLSQLLQADDQVLVVMDALDECKEERLPLGGLYNKCTTLVTSRPWKFEALRCDPESKVDKEIEIVGLKKGSPEDLSEKLVGLLNKKWNKSKMSLEFIWKMTRNGLRDFLNVPVLLTSMLCLWFDDVPFGQSQTEVYKNSIHHQILAAIKAKHIPHYSCQSETLFPICYVDKCPCKCYGELLWKVSELACRALLSNVQERSLVMDHDQTAFVGLSDEDVVISMKLGILTQYKLLGNVTDYEPQKSVIFTHKTYQEWFAAIYLSSKMPLPERDKLLSKAIVDLNSALELEQMYRFVCGLNAEVAAQLHEFIMSKMSSATSVQEYQLTKTIQDVVVAGAVEAKKNNKVTTALQLRDVYIDGNFEMFSTEQILACATSHVRSVYIEHVYKENMDGEEMRVEENMITPWPSSSCIEKLHLKYITNAFDDTFCDNFSAGQLVHLYLDNVTFAHDQLESLCGSLASAGSLITVYISQLTCITHKDNKEDCSIMFDLSQHQGLEDLTLVKIGVGEVRRVSLSQNTDKLRTMELETITLTHDGMESLCASLARMGKHRKIVIRDLTCTAHKDSTQHCFINLDVSLYASLRKNCKIGWRQRPNVNITSLPSSFMQRLILRCVDFSPCDTFCDNFNVDNVSNINLDNIAMTHYQLQRLCLSLASAGGLRTVGISQLVCKTHMKNRKNCYISLDISQFVSLKKICQSGWQQLPSVNITSLTSSLYTKTLVLQDLNFSQRVTFCDNFNVGNVAEMHLGNITVTHAQLESLCWSLALAGSLRSLYIGDRITCITHNNNKQYCSILLDLSQHQGLEDLTLLNLGVVEVRGVSLCPNNHKLKKVDLGYVTLTHGGMESLFASLASAGNLRKVVITCITHKITHDQLDSCKLMLDLSPHQGLEELTLWDLSVGEVQEVSLCQNMDKLEKIWLHNITLSHGGLESLCVSLASAAGSLRTVKIRELNCKTHEDNKHNCYINLDVSQYTSLEKICQSEWQRPNVRVTSLPSSPCLQTLDLRRVNILPCDAFCDNFNVGNVDEIYLVDVKMTHCQLESMCRSVTLAGSLKTMVITQLTCITHQDNRQECSLMWDISHHQGLEDLTLENLGVYEIWTISVCPNMEKLESVYLRNVTLTHDQLESLCGSLASAGSLRTVDIRELTCKTHQDNRHDCSIMLNLAQQQGLKELRLLDLGVGEVQGVSLCQNMEKLERVECNITMTHGGLESLCGSLATVVSLRTVDIRELTCKTHKDNRQDCCIELDFSQYIGTKAISFEKIIWFVRQLQNVKITSWPSSSCMETVYLCRVDISSCDTFCDNFIIDMVSKMYLENVILAHGQLESLCGSLASARSLRTVNIRELTCITHQGNRQECGIMLDFSQHQGLEDLKLWDIGVDEVQGVSLCQNMKKLRFVELGDFCISAAALRQTLEALPVHCGRVRLGGWGAPLRVRGAEEARQLLEIRRTPQTNVYYDDDVEYTGDECVVNYFWFYKKW